VTQLALAAAAIIGNGFQDQPNDRFTVDYAFAHVFGPAVAQSRDSHAFPADSADHPSD
jgi:hypothetical protein